MADSEFSGAGARYQQMGGGAQDRNGLKVVLYSVACLLVFLFCVWVLILLYSIEADVTGVGDDNDNILQKLRAIERTLNDIAENTEGDDNDNGGGGGGGANEPPATFITNNYNTENTYNMESTTVIQNTPLDEIIASVHNNGFACALPPPLDVLPAGDPAIDKATTQLQREWSYLMEDTGLPGLAVAVVYDEGVLFKEQLGLANATDTGRPVEPNTLFRIGGITKLFTTMLAFMERDDGASSISLDEPINQRLLPTFTITDPFNLPRPITIRQMLSDLSGLPRNAPVGCEPESCALTTEQVLALVADSDLQLIHPPYTQPSRSDLAFSLVGRGLESLPSIASYEQAVHNSILAPFNMSDTAFFSELTDDQKSRVAVGYEDDYEVELTDPAWNNPFSGLFSTLDDMIRLVLKLNTFDEELYIREMLLPIFMNPDTKTGQGTPFEMMYFKNHLMRHLSGGMKGYSSSLLLVPDLKLGVIAMGNAEADMSMFTLAAVKKLVPIIQDILSKEAEGPNPPPDSVDQYVGEFLGENDEARMSSLTVRATDDGKLQIVHERYGSDVYLQLSFADAFMADDGTVQRFTAKWAGDPRKLSCLTIVHSGVQNDLVDFKDAVNDQFTTIVYQGEEYRMLAP